MPILGPRMIAIMQNNVNPIILECMLLIIYMAQIVTKCWMLLHYEHVVDGRYYADLVLHIA